MTGVVDMDGRMCGCVYECAGISTGSEDCQLFFRRGISVIIFQYSMYTREILGREN